MKVNVEITDAVGHEPAYTWVKRHTLEVPQLMSHYSIIRRVKSAIGWDGKLCLTNDLGHMIQIRPHGESRIAFITFDKGE